MAKHEVRLEIAHSVNIGNVDVEFPVRVDDVALGRLLVSTGSIDWLPSPNQKQGYSLAWSDFADLIAKHGYKTNVRP